MWVIFGLNLLWLTFELRITSGQCVVNAYMKYLDIYC